MGDKLVRRIEESDIRPLIGKTFEFEEALDAFKEMENGTTAGKIVIRVA